MQIDFYTTLLVKSLVCVESKEAVYLLYSELVSISCIHTVSGSGKRKLAIWNSRGAYQWIIFMYPCIANGDNDLGVPPLASISLCPESSEGGAF